MSSLSLSLTPTATLALASQESLCASPTGTSVATEAPSTPAHKFVDLDNGCEACWRSANRDMDCVLCCKDDTVPCLECEADIHLNEAEPLCDYCSQKSQLERLLGSPLTVEQERGLRNDTYRFAHSPGNCSIWEETDDDCQHACKTCATRMCGILAVPKSEFTPKRSREVVEDEEIEEMDVEDEAEVEVDSKRIKEDAYAKYDDMAGDLCPSEIMDLSPGERKSVIEAYSETPEGREYKACHEADLLYSMVTSGYTLQDMLLWPSEELVALATIFTATTEGRRIQNSSSD